MYHLIKDLCSYEGAKCDPAFFFLFFCLGGNNVIKYYTYDNKI